MGFITRDDLPTKVSELQNDCNYVNINSVPTKLSQLVNDRNFASKDEVPKYTTELSNDAQFTNVVDLAKRLIRNLAKDYLLMIILMKIKPSLLIYLILIRQVLIRN